MTDAATILHRLRAVLDQPDLSKRAATRCARLVARLEAPVRVALFGLPGAGKAAVLNALADHEVLSLGAQCGPVLLRHGDVAGLALTTREGARTAEAATPYAPARGVMISELTLPLDTLAHMSLLNVATDGSPRDMQAALAWAAARSDIAIWCSDVWSAEEQAIWQAGPDSLKNHALLVATGSAESIGTDPAKHGFERAACHAPLAADTHAVPDASATALRRRLAQMISAARAEDVDAAAFVIAQFAKDAPAPIQTDAAPPAPATAPGTAAVTPVAPQVSDEARAGLSRVFLHLRQTAQDLVGELPEEPLSATTAEPLFDRFQEVFDTLLDLAEADPAIPDTWPALHDTLSDAQELVQLLKIEGQPAQAVEAAGLLAQVRTDMEHALAA